MVKGCAGPALKRQAKFIPPLRVEEVGTSYFLGFPQSPFSQAVTDRCGSVVGARSLRGSCHLGGSYSTHTEFPGILAHSSDSNARFVNATSVAVVRRYCRVSMGHLYFYAGTESPDRLVMPELA